MTGATERRASGTTTATEATAAERRKLVGAAIELTNAAGATQLQASVARRVTGTPGGRASVSSDAPGAGLPASGHAQVWLVGQRSPAMQRRGRFVAGSGAHPARMWPDLAAHAIAEYSRPGDLVADPLCGIGTTLVEAIHAGRDTVGVEYEPRWAELARANVALAHAHGGIGRGIVECADATTLHRHPPGVLAVLAGRVDLVLTSPPYGRTMHGRVEHRHGSLTRFARSYGEEDLANLAYRGRVGLVEGITAVLAGVRALLRPGGIAVVTARPWRRDRFLVDLPGDVAAAGIAAGLQPLDHRYALLAGYRDGRFIPRHSFFQLSVARASRRKGRPVHLPAFEHVLVFTRPARSADSTEPTVLTRPGPGPGEPS